MNGSHVTPLPALATAGMRWLAAIVAACLVLAVLLLGARRAMGALAAPLPAGFLMAALGITLLGGVLLRLGAPSTSPAVRWSPMLLLCLLAIALWLPGTSLGGTLLLLGAILADIAIAISMTPRVRSIAAAPSLFPDSVSQQFTRSGMGGTEVIEGHIRTTFGAGQRLEYCHLAFCPPLACVPKVSCEQAEGPQARIKVAQVFSHGARIELRLEQVPTATTAVVLQVHATAHQPRTQA